MNKTLQFYQGGIIMNQIYASDVCFQAENDAQTIQNAVDYAHDNQIRRVIIPRRNPRTGKDVWIIGKTILLPSNITIVLEDCHLRLEDNVFENIFRNNKAWTEEGKTMEGEQHDIRIIGDGYALLDGGIPNGLCEQLNRDFPGKYPHMSCNFLIFLNNVRDFEVSNIHFIESRYWAVCFQYCRWGKITDLDFRMYANLENQDGIDLRVGCEYITIENITGVTGDDTVALTALPRDPRFAGALKVEGKTPDIHDVTIRNIISATHGNNIIRLLNNSGAKIYNITITDLKDTSEAISGSAILMGTTDPYLMKSAHEMGDFRNITVRNVTSNAQRILDICEPCENVLIENVVANEKCETGIYFRQNFFAKNVVIRDFVFAGSEATADSVMEIRCPEEGIADLKLEHLRASRAKYVFRGLEIPNIQDFVWEEPSEAYSTPEHSKLASAYGRYHYMAYGKVIENRPLDNRFVGKDK